MIRDANDSLIVTPDDLLRTKNISSGVRSAGAVYVALGYDLSNISDAEWLYARVRVLPGEAPVGSYFCVLGGPGFYTGLQVNSKKERRVIFSVWDDKNGNNNEKKVAIEDRAFLVTKDGQAEVSRFGKDGGSGIHTHLVYDWKEDTVYEFLVHVAPDTIMKNTTYTLFFLSEGNWKLVSKLRRPNMASYPQAAYSFMEDWTTRDDKERRAAYYENQWVRTAKGKWKEISVAYFYLPYGEGKRKTGDYGCRLSPDAGYLLVSGGGFTGYHLPDGTFLRRKAGRQPAIDIMPE